MNSLSVLLSSACALELAVECYFLFRFIGSPENPLRHELLGGLLLSAVYGSPVFALSVALASWGRDLVVKTLRVTAFVGAVLGIAVALLGVSIGSLLGAPPTPTSATDDSK